MTSHADEDNPDWSHPPRLFVVRPDGSGVELLRNADVRGFLAQRDAEIEGGSAMLLREPLPSEPSAETYTFVWQDWAQMHLASLVAERAQSDEVQLLGFLPKAAPPPPETTSLCFRRLVRRDALSEGQRETLEAELSEMVGYRDQEETRAKELHVVDERTEEQKAAEAEMQREMLKVRRHSPLPSPKQNAMCPLPRPSPLVPSAHCRAPRPALRARPTGEGIQIWVMGTLPCTQALIDGTPSPRSSPLALGPPQLFPMTATMTVVGTAA